jgi:predicted PurR-regulated permease PerM
MIFLSLIPIAGAFVIWMPAVIYLAATGAWIKAILLLIAGLLISLVDNFMRPRLVGKRAKLHDLFIFFAVLGGLHVFGLIGLVLGPVTLAVALSLFEAFRHPESVGPSSSSDGLVRDHIGPDSAYLSVRQSSASPPGPTP